MTTRKAALWAGPTQSFGTRWTRGAAATALVAVAAALVPTAARAGIVTETLSVPSTSIMYSSWTNSMSFQGFNALAPASSSLQSVDIKITESLTGSITATNNDNTSGSIELFVVNAATFSTPTGSPISFSDTQAKTVTIPQGKTESISVSGSAYSIENVTTGLTNFLSPWQSTATDKQADFSAVPSCPRCGLMTTSSPTDYGAITALITYNYTNSASVPEPGTEWLMGIGLVGLLGISRRKRRA